MHIMCKKFIFDVEIIYQIDYLILKFNSINVVMCRLSPQHLGRRPLSRLEGPGDGGRGRLGCIRRSQRSQSHTETQPTGTN